MMATETEPPPVDMEEDDDGLKSTQPTDGEVLKGVVAYVDVRSGHDNRTQGVSLQLQQLGATVSKTFNKKVTHVVFNEGSKATFDKAKRLALPLLSALWVDSCKKNGVRVSENFYPAFVSEEYHSKIVKLRKLKSMQPIDLTEAYARSERILKRRIRREQRKKFEERYASAGGLLQNLSDYTDEYDPNEDFYKIDLPDFRCAPGGLVLFDSSTDEASDEENEEKIPNLARRLFNKMPDSPILQEAFARGLKYRRSKNTPSLDMSGVAGTSFGQNTTPSLDDSQVPDTVATIPVTAIATSTVTSSSQLCSPTSGLRELKLDAEIPPPASPRMSISAIMDRRSPLPESSELFASLPVGNEGGSSSPCLKSVSATLWRSPLKNGKQVNEAVVSDTATSSVDNMEVISDANSSMNATATSLSNSFERVVAKSGRRLSSTPRLLRAISSQPSTPRVTRRSTRLSIFADQSSLALDMSMSDPAPEQASLMSTTLSVLTEEAEEAGIFAEAEEANDTITGVDGDRSVNSLRRTSAMARTLKMTTGIECFKSPRDELPPSSVLVSEDRKSGRSSKRAKCDADVDVVNADAVTVSASTGPIIDSSSRMSKIVKVTPLNRRDKIDSPSRSSTSVSQTSHRGMQKGAKKCLAPILTHQSKITFPAVSSMFTSEEKAIFDSCTKTPERTSAVPETVDGGSIKRKRPRDSTSTSVALVFDPLEVVASTPQPGRTLSQSRGGRTKKLKTNSTVMVSSSSPTTATKHRRSLDDFKVEVVKSKRVQSTLLDFCKARTFATKHVVLTSFSITEKEVLIPIVTKLGGSRIVQQVDDRTTHVVCGDHRRTLNVLLGTVQGCWLLDAQWIYKSMEAGKWADESSFELSQAFPSAATLRQERQLDSGLVYRCRLFQNASNPIFVHPNATTMPHAELTRLLKMAGAKVSKTAKEAKTIVGSYVRGSDAVCLPERWVVDSITRNEVLPYDNYLISSLSPEYS